MQLKAAYSILIILTLLLGLPHHGVKSSCAADISVLRREKEVTLEPVGEIIARYSFVFSSNAATHETLAVNLPVPRPGELQVEAAWGHHACGDQQRPALLQENRLEFVPLCPAAEFAYGFTVRLAADTFSGMFTDRFELSESETGRYVLHLDRPTEIHATVSPSLELLEQQKMAAGRDFSWLLRCEKSCSAGAALTISTFTSQSSMAQRFKELWQAQCNSFSAALPNVNQFSGSSEKERVIAMFGWFRDRFRYETSRRAGHLLVPDSCEKTWASNTGDCKDLSILLSQILKRYNFLASPALISKGGAESGESAETDFLQFVHAVVVTQLDGDKFVLDPSTGSFRLFDEQDKKQLLILDDKTAEAFSMYGKKDQRVNT